MAPPRVDVRRKHHDDVGPWVIDFARALRDAKASVRKRPEWSAPYHWAPFVLTGPR